MTKFRGLIATLLVAVLAFIWTIPVFASWSYRFPITIQDTSNVSRTNVPVLLGFGGQSLVNSGYTTTGLDTNLQSGSTNTSYMMGTTNVCAVIDNLPAGGQVTVDLYTGCSSNQTGFPVITGSSGYVLVTDNDDLELGSNFTVNMSSCVGV